MRLRRPVVDALSTQRGGGGRRNVARSGLATGFAPAGRDSQAIPFPCVWATFGPRPVGTLAPGTRSDFRAGSKVDASADAEDATNMDEAEQDALLARAKAEVRAEINHRARVVGAIALGALGAFLLLTGFFAGVPPGVIVGLVLGGIAWWMWP